jgi:hypothetical protein
VVCNNNNDNQKLITCELYFLFNFKKINVRVRPFHLGSFFEKHGRVKLYDCFINQYLQGPFPHIRSIKAKQGYQNNEQTKKKTIANVHSNLV